MKLFDNNAEILLFEKAKSLSARHDSWRCIYINFSDYRDHCSDSLRTHVVTAIFKELLEEEEGFIYLCEDGDVFILFQGKALPILDKLGEQFKDLGTRGGTMPEEMLHTVLDLARHWQVFFTLCKNKAAATEIKTRSPVIRQPVMPAKAALPEMDRQLFNAAQRQARRQLRVLLVEDDPFTRRLIGATLRSECEIVEAGDAVEALAMYNSTAPDAVFLDIELPDFNGHAVLNRLLAFDPSAFVVMLSGNSAKEHILAAIEKGAKGFVAKPFAKEKLMHYLRLCKTEQPAARKEKAQ